MTHDETKDHYVRGLRNTPIYGQESGCEFKGLRPPAAGPQAQVKVHNLVRCATSRAQRLNQLADYI